MKKRNANHNGDNTASIGESWQDLVESAQALLQTLQNEKGEAVENLREKLSATVKTASSRLESLRGRAGDIGQQAAKSTVRYVRDNPWKSVAIAAVVVLGWHLLNRDDD